jgi:hypothetical protein
MRRADDPRGDDDAQSSARGAQTVAERRGATVVCRTTPRAQAARRCSRLSAPRPARSRTRRSVRCQRGETARGQPEQTFGSKPEGVFGCPGEGLACSAGETSGSRRRAHARGFRPFRSGSPAPTRGDASRRARRARLGISGPPLARHAPEHAFGRSGRAEAAGRVRVPTRTRLRAGRPAGAFGAVFGCFAAGSPEQSFGLAATAEPVAAGPLRSAVTARGRAAGDQRACLHCPASSRRSAAWRGIRRARDSRR